MAFNISNPLAEQARWVPVPQEAARFSTAGGVSHHSQPQKGREVARDTEQLDRDLASQESMRIAGEPFPGISPGNPAIARRPPFSWER